MRDERGITLITLVLTVIIMLILTGVTLNLTSLSNNGVVKKIKNETEIQQDMINQEKEKTSNVIKNYEQEWGLS